jgi:hypothetical protein
MPAACTMVPNSGCLHHNGAGSWREGRVQHVPAPENPMAFSAARAETHSALVRRNPIESLRLNHHARGRAGSCCKRIRHSISGALEDSRDWRFKQHFRKLSSCAVPMMRLVCIHEMQDFVALFASLAAAFL